MARQLQIITWLLLDIDLKDPTIVGITTGDDYHQTSFLQRDMVLFKAMLRIIKESLIQINKTRIAQSWPITHKTLVDLNKNKSEVLCQICDKQCHTSLECWHWFNLVYQLNDVTHALVITFLHNSVYKNWFPNTGATLYMTPCKGINKVIIEDDNAIDFTILDHQTLI